MLYFQTELEGWEEVGIFEEEREHQDDRMIQISIIILKSGGNR